MIIDAQCSFAISHAGGKIGQFSKLCRLPHFMSIAKVIPDERSQKIVSDAFDVLCSGGFRGGLRGL